MKSYEKIKEMLCEELETIAKKGELTAGSLDTVDKLTHAIKSIETIIAMNEYNDDGYSNRGSYENRNGSSYARRYTRDGSMDGGNSYARYGNVRRDSMGRYSRDEANDEIINRLHEVMNDAPNEQTKQEIRKLINKMEQM
jgi:hypothetical protein